MAFLWKSESNAGTKGNLQIPHKKLLGKKFTLKGFLRHFAVKLVSCVWPVAELPR